MNARRILGTSLLLTTLAFVPAVAGARNLSLDAVSESTIRELYQHLIEAENAHDIEKVRALVWDSPSAPSVAETYVPVSISVGYAGQSGTPKPFLMIIEWVRLNSGVWRMATDIALPIPPLPP
jgi:hypothetical protein